GGQKVAAVDVDALQPAEMVQSDVVQADGGVAESGGRARPGGGDPGAFEGTERAAREPDGGVADPDDAVAEDRPGRLGDDAGGVGEVDQPRLGIHLGNRTGDVEGDGQAAQRV